MFKSDSILSVRKTFPDHVGDSEQSGLVEGVPALAGVWNEIIFKVPSDPNPSVIL